MSIGYNGRRWCEGQSITANTTMPSIKVPNDVIDVIAVIKPAGATALRVEYTFDEPDLWAASDASATWFAWASGGVATNTAALLPQNVTGVRGVGTAAGTGGSMTLTGRKANI
jgi:hypothetical protein